jgi:hypothetical protein
MTDDLHRSYPPAASPSIPSAAHNRPVTCNFTMHTAHWASQAPVFLPWVLSGILVRLGFCWSRAVGYRSWRSSLLAIGHW